MIKKIRLLNLKPIDFIPAFSGLIGKIALATSFAIMWAQALDISYKDFVLSNVRIEILIGSIVTLIAALVFPKASPAGTLAPLIVLIPAMAAFGVHPLILGITVGIIGIISVKTGLLKKIVNLSGIITRNSVTLAFGISGIVLCIKRLYSFFQENFIEFLVLIIFLSFVYSVLLKYKKTYLIIIFVAVAAIALGMVSELKYDMSYEYTNLIINPTYWWNNMWKIGFGFNLITILKTLPFAFFVVLLWATDITSLQVIQKSNCDESEIVNELDIDSSYYVISVRNMVGAFFGGAQTGSLWRSFLIPIFMIKRSERSSAIIMAIMGIACSLTALPIKLLSYPPLVWSILLFAIFVPFTVASLINLKKISSLSDKLSLVVFSAIGILINPILTWITAIAYEKIKSSRKKQKTLKKTE